jgi:hypothetical protein
MTSEALGVFGPILAQFIGVAALTLMFTEFMPFRFGLKKPYNNRLTAIIYATILSVTGWVVGLVKVPPRVIAEKSVPLELAVVIVLGLASLAVAHIAHQKFLAGKKPT